MNSEEVKTGTTIMAFKFKEGILLAADSRTSSGEYVSSRITDKLTQITPQIYCCRSGSAADTQRIAREVERQIKLMSIKEGKPPSVEKAAMLVRHIIYNNQDQLLASMIVAGYDAEPRIFQISPCGTIFEKSVAIGGSGSAFIYGFVDDEYKPEMDLDDAIEFAKKAVSMAIRRDIFSGGVVRIASITKNKVSRYILTGDKISNLRTFNE